MSRNEVQSGNEQLHVRDWALRVERLGKVYGPLTPDTLAGTGPEYGTAVSPANGAVVAAWDVNLRTIEGITRVVRTIRNDECITQEAGR